MTDPSGGTGRPDPATARTPTEFVEAMRRLKRWSGLGFRRLEQRALAAGIALPRSTLTAALSRNTLPREDLVVALARTCGCGKEEVDRWVATRRRLAAGATTRSSHVPATSPVTVPAQLPPAVAGFVGRTRQLAALNALLDHAPPAVVISAIGGTAGVGKTALAVHWARRVADRFPDGQLYLNLRGFDPSGLVMSPAEAVHTLLDAFDVPPERIPEGLDGQVSLYRSLLADKRLLVVLDNAHDADQVRPLLPGGPGCLAVVTSRSQLTSLVATHAAHPVILDVMPVAEARELLASRLGAARVAAEPKALDEIIAGCARLPLALAIIAARSALNPRLPLHALAGEIRDEEHRLDALDAGDPATNVRTVFSWSYNELSIEAARLFRMLGTHPAPDIGTAAAASLIGRPVHPVRELLVELTRAHLIAEHTQGRYSLHDLLRTYATELAHSVDNPDDRHAARHRMLDHYLHTANTANRLLNPHRTPIAITTPQPGVTCEPIRDYGHAMAWFTTELATLVGAVHQAAGTGLHIHSWQLAWTLSTFFERQAHWRYWAMCQQAALEAARHLADRAIQAWAHRGLAYAQNLLGRYEDAHIHFQHALDLYQDLGRDQDQAGTHIGVSWMLEKNGRLSEALSHRQQALNLFRMADDKHGQAIALNAIGWNHSLLGDHHQAIEQCRVALAIQREIGDKFGEAHSTDSLAFAHYHLGNHQQAVRYYRRALGLYRDLGDRRSEAETLDRLGDTHNADGDTMAARDAWQRAFDILSPLNYPDADRVRAKLTP